MASGKSKGSLTFTYIRLILLASFFASSAVDVQWEAKFPAVFGNEAYLQCNISDAAFNCTNSPRQWIGGPKYDILCYDDICPVSNKYRVVEQPRCHYTLMIHNFSKLDVDCDYTCSYGVSRMRRKLTLDEKRFIYEPHDEDIHEQTKENGNTLNWNIYISKIFPTPSCGADLNGQSIKESLQISVTKPGFYFQAALQINLPLSSCGKVNIYCKLGDYKINITNKNFDGCQFKGGEKSNKNYITLMLVSTTLTIMIAVSVLVLCMYRKGKLQGERFQFRNQP